jgi:hypothetical protein
LTVAFSHAFERLLSLHGRQSRPDATVVVENGETGFAG